jgi:hypothetical protein
MRILIVSYSSPLITFSGPSVKLLRCYHMGSNPENHALCVLCSLLLQIHEAAAVRSHMRRFMLARLDMLFKETGQRRKGSVPWSRLRLRYGSNLWRHSEENQGECMARRTLEYIVRTVQWPDRSVN